MLWTPSPQPPIQLCKVHLKQNYYHNSVNLSYQIKYLGSFYHITIICTKHLHIPPAMDTCPPTNFFLALFAHLNLAAFSSHLDVACDLSLVCFPFPSICRSVAFTRRVWTPWSRQWFRPGRKSPSYGE